MLANNNKRSSIDRWWIVEGHDSVYCTHRIASHQLIFEFCRDQIEFSRRSRQFFFNIFFTVYFSHILIFFFINLIMSKISLVNLSLYFIVFITQGEMQICMINYHCKKINILFPFVVHLNHDFLKEIWKKAKWPNYQIRRSKMKGN